MKSWQPISNGGKFYVQLTGAHTLHEDSRGLPVHYRSIEGARKAADELNRAMSQAAAILFHRAHSAKRAIDRINGDTMDNHPENLHATTLTGGSPMKCWTIRYYFTHGSKKRLLQGQFCGCIGGETKAAAINSVSPIVPGEGEKDADTYRLVKVTATPSKKGHSCFTNEEGRPIA